ncbi:DNA repair protein RadC [Macrococcus sp. DPC7161]|uniref:RadC family protein n=1 Tax=Macrococcus sp. DPC7161 TaxID=2507060 RepID=UPI00100A7753|nr:DNA repair protein RadC [Macrococcus sp. DPC7161]RXK18158.1 JAB domain-containing protein [Macrococcus sp. DPC7161]
MLELELAIDQPREKLLHLGSHVLTNQELISILLNTGTKTMNVMHLSNHLLSKVNSIHELRDLTLEELMSINGIGEKKAATILAVMELAKRMHTHTVHEQIKVTSPECVAKYLMEKMRYYPQEHFVVLLLNTKNIIFHEHTAFIGSLNASIIHPREIFREAVKRSAASLICVHNHPSGSPEPSYEDIEATKRLVECGQLFGIDVLDHIIIGDGTFVSLKESGVL